MSARLHPGAARTALRVALCALVGVGLLASTLTACGSGRDVIGDSRDVRGATSATAANPNAYDYVARRGLGVVALAEGRGLTAESAAKATDAVADHLQACASELQAQGKLARGAVRVVAEIGDDGTVGALNIKVSGGARVTANAILCVVAPLRAHLFPAPERDAGRRPRGIALEATWDGAEEATTPASAPDPPGSDIADPETGHAPDASAGARD